MGIGQSRVTKSEHPSALGKVVEFQEQREEVRWRTHPSVSVVAMSDCVEMEVADVGVSAALIYSCLTPPLSEIMI